MGLTHSTLPGNVDTDMYTYMQGRAQGRALARQGQPGAGPGGPGLPGLAQSRSPGGPGLPGLAEMSSPAGPVQG